MTPSAQLLTEVTAAAPTVSLAQLNARAEMLTRVDRKYLVDLDQLSRLLAQLAGQLDVLDIDGRRVFGYTSTYFDTPDLLTFRAHVQQRRRRYKVRIREYLETGGQFLEVKYKGYRQQTAKERRPHTEGDVRTLGRSGHDFAAKVIGEVYGIALPDGLEPAIRTSNRRCTFLSRSEDARMTVDVQVAFGNDHGAAAMKDRFAIIETKSGGAGTSADRVLRSMGVRTTSVSKYCAGIGLLRDDLPANPWHRLLRTHFEHTPEDRDAPLDAVADGSTNASTVPVVPVGYPEHVPALAG